LELKLSWVKKIDKKFGDPARPGKKLVDFYFFIKLK
jgi:hypothetical protein